MRRKIIGVCVCMLLLATAIPAVESIKTVGNLTTISNYSTNMRLNWTEMQKLNTSDSTSMDNFGWFVSISGNTALIGAPYDDDNGDSSGSAYVFIQTGGIWTQQAKLLPADGATGDMFGRSVSINGDSALIGACGDDSNKGAAYVFTRSGSTWTQQAKLLGQGGAVNDWFGYYVSIDGDTALIGAVAADANGVDSGSAYVFNRSGNTWTHQQLLVASDASAYDAFGCSVSLNGDTAVIGAAYDDDNGGVSGSAYVFNRSGTSWGQQAKLLAPDGASGDYFGSHVSIYGDSAFITAYEDDDNGDNSGSAYIFTRTGITWTHQQKLLASDGTANDRFGSSVSTHGDTVIFGAFQDEDNGANSGSAYVFAYNGSTWEQQIKLLASDGVEGDYFGCSVSIYDHTALIGAYSNNDDKGSAYVFLRETENQAPTADFNYSPEHPTTSDIITFTDESNDTDGTIVSWNWDFGDGNSSTEKNPTHIYGVEGIYNVTLSVVDDDGASATVTKQIVVVSQQFKVALIFGRITNVTTLTDIVTFEAVKTRVITFSPINFIIYSSNEKITIETEIIGYIDQSFICGLCKVSLPE